MSHKEDKYQFIGNYAATISIIEIGIGSFLHSFKIPFSGHFLSLNQGFILSRASLEKTIFKKNQFIEFQIGTITSLLKSLSPAGKKLTPMLAISIQSFLFNLGVFFLGRNIFGVMIGFVLLSIWAFIQPFMIYFVLYGKDLVYMTDYFLKKLSIISLSSTNLIQVIIGLILIKVFLAIVLSLVSLKISEQTFTHYQEFFKKYQSKKTDKKPLSPTKGALKDISSPLFIISICLMGLFYFFSRSNYSEFLWQTLRPLIIAFILFYLIRRIPIENIARHFKSKSLLIALKKLKEL